MGPRRERREIPRDGNDATGPGRQLHAANVVEREGGRKPVGRVFIQRPLSSAQSTTRNGPDGSDGVAMSQRATAGVDEGHAASGRASLSAPSELARPPWAPLSSRGSRRSCSSWPNQESQGGEPSTK